MKTNQFIRPSRHNDSDLDITMTKGLRDRFLCLPFHQLADQSLATRRAELATLLIA